MNKQLSAKKTSHKKLINDALAHVPEAEYELGLQCAAGLDGTARDYAEAVQWLQRAANQKYGPAQYALAVCYKDGIGVRKDVEKAISWYSKAAKLGQPFASYHLQALLHLVADFHDNLLLQPFATFLQQHPVRTSEDFSSLLQHADQGDKYAQLVVSACYYYGRATRHNVRRAVKWLRMAAEQQVPEAQFLLGLIFLRKEVRSISQVEAYRWLQQAADRQYPLAALLMFYFQLEI